MRFWAPDIGIGGRRAIAVAAATRIHVFNIASKWATRVLGLATPNARRTAPAKPAGDDRPETHVTPDDDPFRHLPGLRDQIADPEHSRFREFDYAPRVKLTIERYLLPTGRSIHRELDDDGTILSFGGVEPDHAVEPARWDAWRLEEVRRLRGEGKLREYVLNTWEDNRFRTWCEPD